MEKIAQALREAYRILSEAQVSDSQDLDEAYLAIEEANGFVAEALDLVDHPTPNPNSVTISNIDAMSDTLYDALDEAFKEELVAQGRDAEVGWDYWTIKADFTPYNE